ncbi:hypothetical protein HRG84_09415 [Flavisolibacter sp. BT320]|nr:hypothetical protein [Flavisolibacter longurius]
MTISDLKAGDVVKVIDEGVEREGVVTDVDKEENQAQIDNGIQEFWYNPDQIIPLPMTEDRLINILGFEKEETPEGVKFKRGPFRVVVHDPGNYTNLDVWYREDHRHFNHALYLHELQNHHLDMTKVQLERVPTHK